MTCALHKYSRLKSSSETTPKCELKPMIHAPCYTVLCLSVGPPGPCWLGRKKTGLLTSKSWTSHYVYCDKLHVLLWTLIKWKERKGKEKIIPTYFQAQFGRQGICTCICRKSCIEKTYEKQLLNNNFLLLLIFFFFKGSITDIMTTLSVFMHLCISPVHSPITPEPLGQTPNDGLGYQALWPLWPWAEEPTNVLLAGNPAHLCPLLNNETNQGPKRF